MDGISVRVGRDLCARSEAKFELARVSQVCHRLGVRRCEIDIDNFLAI